MSIVFNSNSVRLGNADYNEMKNKPAIDGKELTSKTKLSDLGLDKALVYKGQVANEAALNNITDKKPGDVYNIEDNGKNFAWSGSKWDDLDSDLWATKEEVGEISNLNNKATNIVNAINKEGSDRTTAINTHNTSATAHNDIRTTLKSKLAEVVHDDSLTGKGTTAEPLSVAKPKIILRKW